MPKVYSVNVVMHFTEPQIDAALKWGRKMKYTYERDGEIADLLVAAALANIITVDDYQVGD